MTIHLRESSLHYSQASAQEMQRRERAGKLREQLDLIESALGHLADLDVTLCLLSGVDLADYREHIPESGHVEGMLGKLGEWLGEWRGEVEKDKTT